MRIRNSKSEKLLGTYIYTKLKFDKHVQDGCDKGSKKINSLARPANYIELTRRRILMNTFFIF